jgi:hypothetical protein
LRLSPSGNSSQIIPKIHIGIGNLMAKIWTLGAEMMCNGKSVCNFR